MNMAKQNEFEIDPFKDIPKSDDFRVPEGYFEALPGEIRDRLDKPMGNTAAKNVWKRRWWYIGAAAAMVVLMFGLLPRNVADECQTFACLLDNTIVTDEDIQWLDNEVDIEMLFDDDIDEEELF